MGNFSGRLPLMALLSRIASGALLSIVAVVFVFNFSMSMNASSGLPYWDDWQYFFGTSQGLHVPLTLKSLLAKEADYVTPVMRVFGHLVWQLVGANFLVLRLIAWALFGGLLLLYARFLFRFATSHAWVAAALLLCLVSTASVEYFYYQHMALSQPLFFVIFLSYLWLAAVGRATPAIFLLILAASFSIFGSAYAMGAIGYAVALAIAAHPRQGWAAFRDPRVWAAVPAGLVVVAGIGYLTFSGSYVNHTGQTLVGPWTADFWIFLFSAFAAVLGFPADTPTRYLLPLGLFGFLLYAWPLWRMARQPPADDKASGEFALGALLAGTIAITMVTGAGRAHLCGTDLAGLKACGATPRYVFPMLLALPAAVLATLRVIPDRRRLRSAAALVILGVIAAGYGLNRDGRPSLARWDFAPLNRMMTERDALARACLIDYLAQARSVPNGALDWSRPLICPSMWTANDLTPYLRRAYDTDAPFLKPLLAGLDKARPEFPIAALLGASALAPNGQALRIDLPVATGSVIGYADRLERLKDGTTVLVGWAADTQAGEPAAYVVVTAGGRVVGGGATGSDRSDVAASLGNPALAKSGFVAPLAVATDAPLRVFAISRSLSVVELGGAAIRAAAPPAAPPATVSPANAQTPPTPDAATVGKGSRIVPAQDVTGYSDGRPTAFLRLNAVDQGVVLRHGDGPDGSDALGARDVWAFRSGDQYFMHYDAAGPSGWLAALATSSDGARFDKRGPILQLGRNGEGDSASASYGTTYFDGRDWHMFYLGTPNSTSPPDRIPAFPYLTMKAISRSPTGPWTKQPEVAPFRPQPGSYYSETASPGQIVRHGDDYLQFFSAAMPRTIGIARTRDLNGPWTINPSPILPPSEQIENASLYFQESTKTWFLFTNHVGLRDGVEFTDAIWVYWTQDLERWDPARKAVVLDGRNSNWSKTVIGLPSVLPIGDRLAIYYDGLSADGAAGEPFSHMRRDIGLAWLDLPIQPPDAPPAPTVVPRLLDRVDPLTPRPAGLTSGDPAALSDPLCVLDKVGTASPSPQPLPVTGLLELSGWSVLSGRDGVAPDRLWLSVRNEEEGNSPQTFPAEPLYAQARKSPRPDVGAHLGHPGMNDPGFVAALDLTDRRGRLRLDLLQERGGALYPCGVGQTITLP